MEEIYVLLHEWDHDEGCGACVIAASREKNPLRKELMKSFNAFRRIMENEYPEGNNLWDADYTEIPDETSDCAGLGYEIPGEPPYVWRWSIEKIRMV